MPYIPGITDRTQADVDYAIQLINQNLAADLKGAFNISDFNRIADNTKYLRDLIWANSYYPVIQDQAHITEANYPFQASVIDVMRRNVIILVNAFYKFGNPAIVYGSVLNYTQVNNIEKNLEITNTLLVNMIAEMRHSGEIISGDTALPL